MTNKHGLERYIPADIRKQIRSNSKNGCVICRNGVYQYEHIDPEFNDAKNHDPNKMCCLCASCHDKVTRGQLSKKTVLSKYQEIRNNTDSQSPSEFFDFYEGKALLKFGNLVSEISPESVLEIYDEELFSVTPGSKGEIGKVNAKFFDDNENLLFEIKGNEWFGPSEHFDLEITGKSFTIRLPNGRIGLKLVHNPPDEIEIERLDMRYKDVHLLFSANDLAIGKYNGHGSNIAWIHFKGRIDSIIKSPVAIKVGASNASFDEYQAGISLNKLGLVINQLGEKKGVLSTNQKLTNHINAEEGGIFWPALGIEIAAGCQFAMSGLLTGICGIEHARKHFFSKNRMNAASLFLPAVINKESLEAERKKANHSSDPKELEKGKEAFLVQEDGPALDAWNERRKNSEKDSKIVTTPFQDDKPGLYSAYGVIKQVDSYEGPVVRIKKE